MLVANKHLEKKKMSGIISLLESANKHLVVT